MNKAKIIALAYCMAQMPNTPFLISNIDTAPYPMPQQYLAEKEQVDPSKSGREQRRERRKSERKNPRKRF